MNECLGHFVLDILRYGLVKKNNLKCRHGIHDATLKKLDGLNFQNSHCIFHRTELKTTLQH